MGAAIVAGENREAVLEALHVVKQLKKYGYDSVWLSDVVVSSPRYADLAYEMEPIGFASYLAAETDKLILGTSVLLLPQRNPVLIAKQAATLDILTVGRFVLGVGAGYRRDEMEFLGIEPGLRGRRMEEYLTVVRKLLTKQTVTFNGEFTFLRRATIGIKPYQRGGPQIWVGGNSSAAELRAVRFGDAWHPQNMRPEELGLRAAGFLARINGTKKQLTLRVGVDFREENPGPWAQIFGSPIDVLTSMNAYSRIGVSHIVLVLGWDVKTISKNVRIFGEKVLGRSD